MSSSLSTTFAEVMANLDGRERDIEKREKELREQEEMLKIRERTMDERRVEIEEREGPPHPITLRIPMSTTGHCIANMEVLLECQTSPHSPTGNRIYFYFGKTDSEGRVEKWEDRQVGHYSPRPSLDFIRYRGGAFAAQRALIGKQSDTPTWDQDLLPRLRRGNMSSWVLICHKFSLSGDIDWDASRIVVDFLVGAGGRPHIEAHASPLGFSAVSITSDVIQKVRPVDP